MYFKGNVILITENKIRYIYFTKFVDESEISFRFLDEIRFKASSLDKLGDYLYKAKRLFVEVGYSSLQIELLKRKEVFAYDYVWNFDKLK